MVGRVDYSSVPASVDFEHNHNSKKYTVNKPLHNKVIISRWLCGLLTAGAILLAILVGLLVYFLIGGFTQCGGREVGPQALQKHLEVMDEGVIEEVSEMLPGNVRPVHYSIRIVPNFANATTSGSETITLEVLEDTNEIIFHVNDIKIDAESVKVRKHTQPSSQPSDSIDNQQQSIKLVDILDQDHIEGQRYLIRLAEKMKKDETYYLTLNFEGELNGQLQGFYKFEYTNYNGDNMIGASTQFSPTDARRAFPCWDEPAFKAKFSLIIARPGNMSTLANMPIEKTETYQVDENNNQWFWDIYSETPKMSTYLVAFIVSDLQRIPSSEPLMRFWARKEYLPFANYSLTIAPKILKYYEKYFGIGFPLPKIDVVAVPDFGFSAMENWGLITFRESALLYDPQSSTVENQKSIATIMSHELAHQWFGNLVTPKWWKDLWLKEGFATYLEYMGVDHAEPDWKILDEFLRDEMKRAMEKDVLESSRPISFDMVNSQQIRQAFDDISYAKGACIIRMMNHFLGEETFKNGLSKFLEKFKNSNADRNDLFDSLTDEAHLRGVLMQNESVKDVMDTWTEQPGFPVLNVAPDYKKNSLRIIQKRFLRSNTKDLNSKWWIPISYTSSAKPDFENTKPKFWLRGETEIVESVDAIGDWYLLNVNQTGYYIVNYDEKNWKSLSSHIMELPPLIRAQLISDSMELARANQLDYSIPLTLIAKMAIQDSMIMFVPTAMTFDKLSFLSDMLHNTPAFGYFEEYHNSIFKATYELVTFEDPFEHYLTRRIRQTVLEWSCRGSESNCAHQSRFVFRKWMADGKTILPNLRQIAYCTAIREGTHVEWEFAYQKYIETTSPTEKNVLLDALGCTKEKWLLSRYIEKLLLLDSNNAPYSIRIQDADRVFEAVAANRHGTDIAFNFLRRNWNQLVQHYGEGFNIIGKMVVAVAQHMTTEFQLAEMERFRDSIQQNVSVTKQAFDSAIEIIKSNVDWLDNNYKEVEEWLKKYHHQFGYL